MSRRQPSEPTRYESSDDGSDGDPVPQPTTRPQGWRTQQRALRLDWSPSSESENDGNPDTRPAASNSPVHDFEDGNEEQEDYNDSDYLSEVEDEEEEEEDQEELVPSPLASSVNISPAPAPNSLTGSPQPLPPLTPHPGYSRDLNRRLIDQREPRAQSVAAQPDFVDSFITSLLPSRLAIQVGQRGLRRPFPAQQPMPVISRDIQPRLFNVPVGQASSDAPPTSRTYYNKKGEPKQKSYHAKGNAVMLVFQSGKNNHTFKDAFGKAIEHRHILWAEEFSTEALRTAYVANNYYRWQAARTAAIRQYERAMTDWRMGEQDPSGKTFKWEGRVLPSTAGTLKVIVSASHRPAGRVLTNLTASIHFGSHNVPYKQALQAIRYVMYGNPALAIPSSNWVKPILLAHDLRSFSDATPATVPKGPTWHPRFVTNGRPNRLNNEQRLAVMKGLAYDDSAASRFTLLIGPPGTGKTTVSTCIIYSCIRNDDAVIVTAGSNQALDNLAKNVVGALENAGGPVSLVGVYRLHTAAQESWSLANFDDGLTTRSYLRADALGLHPTTTTFGTPEQNLVLHQGSNDHIELAPIRKCAEHLAHDNPLSLGTEILRRVKKALIEGADWVDDGRHTDSDQEYTLLRCFINCHLEADSIIDTESIGAPDALVLYGNPDEADDDQPDRSSIQNRTKLAWKELQKFYLSRAKVVFVTASTAGRTLLQVYKPIYCLIEEACQLREEEAVNSYIRYYSTLAKIIQVGDPKQLPPCVMSKSNNEFALHMQRSQFERLQAAGIPVERLVVQYRMVHGIGVLVNELFYDNQLIHDRSTALTARPLAQAFSTWAQIYGDSHSVPVAAHQSVLFIHVDRSQLYCRRGSTSLVNPQYIDAIHRVIASMRGNHELGRIVRDTQAKIAVLCFYKQEQRLLNKWVVETEKWQNVIVSTVDACQGDEFDFVILATCRNSDSGLGFTVDEHRQCVALSRGKNGLVVVGDRMMGVQRGLEQATAGQLRWNTIVNYCTTRGALVRTQGSVTGVDAVLGCPSDTAVWRVRNDGF